MPFFIPWTDAEPARRARETPSGCGATGSTGRRTNGPSPWGLRRRASGRDPGHRRRELPGRAIGRDGVVARLAHQGQGLRARDARGDPPPRLRRARRRGGPERRVRDNAASIAVSHAVGYAENGEARGRRRDGSARTIRLRLAATPGSAVAATTSSSAASTTASTCSSPRPRLRPGRREPMSLAGPGPDAVLAQRPPDDPAVDPSAPANDDPEGTVARGQPVRPRPFGGRGDRPGLRAGVRGWLLVQVPLWGDEAIVGIMAGHRRWALQHVHLGPALRRARVVRDGAGAQGRRGR